jgi:hypothetical protein
MANRPSLVMLEWAAYWALDQPDPDPDPAPRSFVSLAIQETIQHLLICQGSRGPGDAECDARIARLLGWREVRVEYVTIRSLSRQRATGLRPDDWAPGRRDVVPNWTTSHDAFESDLVPILLPGVDDEASLALLGRYVAWIKNDFPHDDTAGLFSCAWTKSAAFLLARLGYVPIARPSAEAEGRGHGKERAE